MINRHAKSTVFSTFLQNLKGLSHYLNIFQFTSISRRFRMRKFYFRIDLICLIILIYLLINIVLNIRSDRQSISDDELPLSASDSKLYPDVQSTLERSRRALESLKDLLNKVRLANDPPWIWTPSGEYPSVPYQPTALLNRTVPRAVTNESLLTEEILSEIDRVCQRLLKTSPVKGKIWCKLFNNSYASTIATTVTLLDDDSTYVITGDIDLMWLRDSSAQVHQYLSLWKHPRIQRLIEGVIRRQVKFIFANPYGSAFRLTLRPNPPSDDSLQPIHVQKARNINVAMHNYELDSLCYHIRLSYSWWKRSKRSEVFDRQWLHGISIIIQVMIIEQHHSQVSPYRYTELPNNYLGTPVAYTGMTWSAFRPSDDQTRYGYLIPSNMMATVALDQLFEMVRALYPKEHKLLKQIYQLRIDILDGINTYGIVKHPSYGDIYAYETNGFSDYLLRDDANVPSLLSASYLEFKNPYDPNDEIIQSTRRFVLSKNNPYFFNGTYGSGIGSEHTPQGSVWPMAIIMEGLTLDPIKSKIEDLDSVWKRLETTHGNKFFMHESFNVDDPNNFTREWFAWVNSLFAELVINKLDQLEDWLKNRRSI